MFSSNAPRPTSVYLALLCYWKSILMSSEEHERKAKVEEDCAFAAVESVVSDEQNGIPDNNMIKVEA